jgi:hypothetical protein
MLVFLYLLNVVLVTRAFWVFRDGKVSLQILIPGIAIQLLALVALRIDSIVLTLAAGVVLLINFLNWFLEHQIKTTVNRLSIRLVSFAVWLIFLGVFSSDLFEISFAGWVLKCVQCVKEFGSMTRLIEGSHMFVFLASTAGTIIAVFEAHVAIRFLFEMLNVKPGNEADNNTKGVINVDQVDYNRGRVIGALERLLTFFLVLQGAYGALGFLIAAKGITRFKQLDDREFAEYFLIGTLLSIILAGSVALLTRILIETWI